MKFHAVNKYENNKKTKLVRAYADKKLAEKKAKELKILGDYRVDEFKL